MDRVKKRKKLKEKQNKENGLFEWIISHIKSVEKTIGS